MSNILVHYKQSFAQSVFIVFALCLACACSQGKFMSYDSYHSIAIGGKISDIQVLMGRPYEVKELGPHKQEYVYIERVSVGEHRELFRRYILTVENDKIIDKKMSEETTSPFQFIGS